jgi:hypothetical protein
MHLCCKRRHHSLQLLHSRPAQSPYVLDSLKTNLVLHLPLLLTRKPRDHVPMTKLRRIFPLRSACGIFWIALSLSPGMNLGCARQQSIRAANPDAQDPGATATASPEAEQKLPFRPDAETAAAGDGAHPTASPEPKSANGVPFPATSHPRILPAGTLLTVQLEDSLSTAKVRAGDVFTASVAAPLTIDGDVFIDRGATVTGRVESAQSPADRPGLASASGYFRLILNAITVNDRQLALQTSSLFARGTAEPSKASMPGNPADQLSGGARIEDVRYRDVQVRKGRRLTFRLTAPLTLNDPNSMAKGQFPGPVSE